MIELKGTLGIDDFKRIVINGEDVAVSEETLKKVSDSFTFLKDFSQNKIIYGVNTGFGPMAQYKIKDDQRIALQYNLIRSHASGSGKPIAQQFVKASLLARLNTLSLGCSGIHPSAVTLMAKMINADILPVIYEHGGVGASGDLVQLAHVALALIGEGEVYHRGAIVSAEEAFKKENLTPISIALREGLALMNGTSVMSGIGMVNVMHARQLLKHAVSASAAINEIVKAYDDHLSSALNQSKMHKGQREIAAQMRDHLSDSKLTRKREHHLYNGVEESDVFHEKIQEYYSLRCVPQILGPVLDTLNTVEKILVEEVNSANDNPIIDLASQQVYHGGNFHGDYVSLEMDKLKIVVTKLGMLAERQLNYLLNSKLNDILPPFVNLGKLGLNFGMQGAQFTATSTTAENQMLSNPMYVHSIPNNNDNQDIVSMGANAALITSKVIENTFQILAVEMLTIVQAIEYLEVQDSVSSKTKKIYEDIRKIVPSFTEDRVLYPKLEAIKTYLQYIE
ncbi:MAG: aromatic amino acid ammonia-lyase [Marinirhabdus sp.]|nr:aromatic amino acid ammonia-lyase [Marinirhabdus sp.]